MISKVTGVLVRSTCAVSLSLILAGCTGSSDSVNPAQSEGMIVSGSVGDGPITGAEIRVTDAFGSLVTTGTSDSSAAYRLEIPDGTPLPVTVEATGGVDLVTGGPAEFPLQGASFATGDVTVNLSPYTTLALGIARCGRTLTEARLNSAWLTLDGSINLGWISSIIANPMSEPVTEANVATVLLSNEALGEVVRRAVGALSSAGVPTEPVDIINGLACDLADGRLDANAQGVDAQVQASTVGALLSVQLEVLAGQLHVDNQPANGLLDAALATIMPGSAASVADVGVAEGLLQQTINTLAVLQGLYDDDMLFDLVAALGNASLSTVRTVAQNNLASFRGELIGLAERIALADQALISQMQQRLTAVVSAPLPSMSFSAADTSVLEGAGTTLSWAVSGVERCLSGGSWTGERNADGVFPTGALNANATYTLTCVGLGGVASGSVAIVVQPDPGLPPAPVVSLSAQPVSVASGGSTTLTWSATNASSCSSSWAGDVTVGNSQTVGPLSATTTYMLTCSGPGGSDTGSVTVSVAGSPPPSPLMTFAAADAVVDSGGTTTLTWSSTNADSCTASGAWSGARGTAGSEVVGPLSSSATFSLTCSGAGGNVMEMLVVAINGQVTLEWQAPTENVDGSALTDLSGFRIYYGETSRNYTGMIDVMDPTATTRTFPLTSGSYYVAMTALDANDDESAYSNEVIKTVQ